MGPTTINTTEAARRAGVSTDTIRRWSRLGYLHPVRVGPGRRYRIDADELATVIGSTVETGTPAETFEKSTSSPATTAEQS